MATWAVANNACDRGVVRDQFGTVLFRRPEWCRHIGLWGHPI